MGGKPSKKIYSTQNMSENPFEENEPVSSISIGQSMKNIVSNLLSGKPAIQHNSTIDINMYLHKITFSLFGTNFPRELIIEIMKIYHSFNKVKLFVGEGHFSNVGAGIQKLTLFIVDIHTHAWVALPGDSNGYIIHSPDGVVCSAWCGSCDDRYSEKVIKEPNGEEVHCVNDPQWAPIMKRFNTWKKWEEKNNIITFSREDVSSALTYKVEINLEMQSNDSENWKYWSHSDIQYISHDGKLHTTAEITPNHKVPEGWE
jgi:hypothetical protein